ncbi:RNA polymerase sigma factor [Microbacterium sp. cf046]|uniref:RNA polymerase sigma factor n=1 Tax=Microbacterium sp. cf046 TaxID=1761803 RepID=UPI000AEE2233|nr:RNA polymerase sigma factor [Microbacterium sp. cf046]
MWQQLLAGNERAYGLIWDRHRDRVFRHLVMGGNSATDAEDLTAAVFLELWRRRSSIRFVDESALPWLIVTAQNVTRNATRARIRHRRFLSRLPPSRDQPDHAELHADQNDETVARLRLVISVARPADARLLATTALEGFTVSEAAGAMGISEPAAKMRLSRLRSRLRADLQPDLSAEGGV